MSKTRIDWCDEVWNPVWGCKRECFFKCYAKGFHKRFAKKLGITNPFEKPTWIESNFQKKLPNKPKRIFVGSMSDIEYWEDGWMQKVLNKIKDYPQHTFLFLTKNPSSYVGWNFPENCWIGVTWIGTEFGWLKKAIPQEVLAKNKRNIKFISIEPLLGVEEPVMSIFQFIDWVIVGGLTPKPVHKRVWVEDILKEAKRKDVPVFLKNNLHWHKKIQEFPG